MPVSRLTRVANDPGEPLAYGTSRPTRPRNSDTSSAESGTRRTRRDFVCATSKYHYSPNSPRTRTRFTSAAWALHNSPHLSPVPSASRHTGP